MDEIEIRKARPGDARALAEVLSTSYRDTMRGLEPAAEVEQVIERLYTPAALREEIQKPGWNGYYVALHEGEIIGAGGGAFLPPRSSELYVLYIHPRWRQRGVGRRLLRAITAEMVEQGADEQWVTVHPQNEKGIPFYRQLGFKTAGELALHSVGSSGIGSGGMLRLRRPLVQENFPPDKK